MSEFRGRYEVFSPRWGGTDTYTVTMSRDSLRIGNSSNQFAATCSKDEDGEFVWIGYNDKVGNPLIKIFRNDSIYVSDVVPKALEWAWDRWKEGEVTDDELKDGLRDMFAWIDITARGKPRGPVWEGYF